MKRMQNVLYQEILLEGFVVLIRLIVVEDVKCNSHLCKNAYTSKKTYTIDTKRIR